jgi:predicted phage terminase large subunit-like protein
LSPGSLRHLPPLTAVQAEIDRRAAERDRRNVELHADEIRARCRPLAGFVREAWHVLEPTARYVHNWHVDAICEHLEAISRGQITRLLCNTWPGSTKSLLVSVMWQAWEWGPAGLPSMRHLATAFNDGPVKRDTRKCRDLIMSPWYQALWPHVALTRTAEMSFANSATGTREGVAFGSLTSQRGDRLTIDDPHSTETAESDAERQATTRKFREGALNRLNDQERSAIVVIMQRLHEDDVSGVILKLGMDFVHLRLPMEFEPERRCSTPIGFVDPRQADGELADPGRFPRKVVEQLKRDMGSYAYAGQYQQRPTAREGGMFKRAWFESRIISDNEVPAGTKWVRHWDLAATASRTAARTAGVKLGRTPTGGYVVGHAITTQAEGNAVRTLIKTTAAIDGRDVEISLPQDPGQAGKVQARDMVAMLAGFVVHAEPETGSKETRAEPFAAQCEAGNVQIVRGPWNDLYLDELCLFPGGSFKDQVDASSGAFGRLAAPTGAGMLDFYRSEAAALKERQNAARAAQ